MPKSFAESLVRPFAALLMLSAASGALAQIDPASVQQKMLDSLGRGDAAAALTFYTDDAVIDSQSGFCASAPCVGKAAIQKDLERYVADKSRRVTVLDAHVTGNVVVTRFEARSSVIQAAGVDRIILWGIREIRGNQIASSRCCLPERTDSQTARFLAWDFSHPTVQQ